MRRRLVAALTAPAGTRARALVVLDPELVGPALLWTRLRRQRLIVDVHEDYVAVADDRTWARGPAAILARGAARATCWLSAYADLTVVADEHVPPRRARQRLVVRNLPTLGELPASGSAAPTPRAIYVGDLRPSRGLWTMLDAVAGAPGWELDAVGELNEVTTEAVRRRVTELGLDDRVRFHGRLPLSRAWELAVGAWCGLALLADTPAYRRAVPTKVYEYLAIGLPVLASPLPRVEELLERSRAGHTAEDADAAAAMLRRWSAHPDELRQLRGSASSWAGASLAGPSPFALFAQTVHDLLTPPKEPR